MFRYGWAKISPFRKGVIFSFPVWGSFLFTGTPIEFADYFLIVAKAGMIAFVSGMGTSLGTDFHNELKKRYKKYKDEKRRNSRKAA